MDQKNGYGWVAYPSTEVDGQGPCLRFGYSAELIDPVDDFARCATSGQGFVMANTLEFPRPEGPFQFLQYVFMVADDVTLVGGDECELEEFDAGDVTLEYCDVDVTTGISSFEIHATTADGTQQLDVLIPHVKAGSSG